LKYLTRTLKKSGAILLGAAVFARAILADGVSSQGKGAETMTARGLLGEAIVAEVLAAGKSVRTSSGGKPSLLPAVPAADPIREALAAEKPNLLVEVAFVLQRTRPTGTAGRDAELASIYGLMRSVSSLEGIVYWSASRGTWRTFYAESYRVDGPDSRRRLPDDPAPRPGAVPPFERLYAFQRDLSFGANLYSFDFNSRPDSIVLETTNLTRMNYGPIPILEPAALKTRILILLAEDALVFYVESGAKAPGLLRGKLEDSFSNRAQAIFRWFSEKWTNAGGR
jgi:hypothetical protein